MGRDILVNSIVNHQAFPKISVLVPSYNHRLYIAETIKSIWDQNYPNLQLVVVDDGSTDGSFELISQMALHSPIEMVVVTQSNKGLCKTLNHALSLASGEIISVIASDDVMMPERLLKEAPYFLNNEELKVLYSNGCFCHLDKIYGDVHNSIKVFLKRGITPTLQSLLTKSPALYMQAMLISRELLCAIGGIDEETGSDDWALNIRVFQSLKKSDEYIFLENNAFMYRLHAQQNHRVRQFMSPMIRRVVRKYFSLENRSHYFCNQYLKCAFRCFFSGNLKKSIRYLKKVFMVANAPGIPWKCIGGKILNIPNLLVRNVFFY